MFEQLPKNKAFRLNGDDWTVFKIDEKTGSIRIWFRDSQVFVAMPEKMINEFLKSCESRDCIIVDKLPTNMNRRNRRN